MSECIHSETSPSGRIEVWQEDGRRSLWFDDTILQSEIDLGDPGKLPNPANRAMLGHLMFVHRPQHVLLAGCGGGAVARWFHFHDAAISGEAIEISPAVARIARDYFDFPATDSTWRLEIANVQEYATRSSQRYDFVLVDLEHDQQTPAWATSPAFLSTCRQRLTATGVLTVNLIIDDATNVAQAIWNLRRVFDRRVLCLPVPGHDNLIIMAFNALPDTRSLAIGASAAERLWGLEFATFLNRLKKHNPLGSGIF